MIGASAGRTATGGAPSCVAPATAVAWDIGSAGRDVAGALVCRCLRIAEAGSETEDVGRLIAWADEVLSPGERTTWDGLTSLPKRRAEWLSGRIVAKAAAIAVVRSGGGRAMAPREVEIVADSRGRPDVRCPDEVGAAPVVTISHTRGMAIALAGPGPDLRVGIDIERVLGKYPRFQQLAFTPDERLLVDGDERARSEWFLRLWCAKEAAGKALGRGLADGLRAIQVRGVRRDTGEVRLAFGHQALSAETSRTGEYIVATVVDQGRERA